MQVEARIVGILREIGGRGHVLAQEARGRPELGLAHEIDRDPIGGRIALHEAEHERLARLRGGLGQAPRLRFVGPRRLLHENRQTARQRKGPELQMRRRADRHAHGVDVLARDQGFRVGRAVLRRDAVAARGLRQPRRIRVAQRGQHGVVAHEMRQKHFSGMRAATDPADSHAALRAASRQARNSAALAANSGSSSRCGARHCATQVPAGTSSRRNGSSVIGPR